MALGNSFDLTINQGETFNLTVTWTDSAGSPINLTGYTARLQVRETYSSTATVVSLTSGAGITLGGAAGTIAIVIAASTTAALTAPFSGVYDLELVNSSVVTRLLQGVAVVTPEVSR
jgi:hypothetical protein